MGQPERRRLRSWQQPKLNQASQAPPTTSATPTRITKAAPSMDEWIRQAIKYANGSLWNNGSWGQRDMKGKPGTMSVHATGRAVDLSYRDMPDDRGKPNGANFPKYLLRPA